MSETRYASTSASRPSVRAVRRQYFTGGAPASTMVEVSKFVSKDYLIEINAIGVLSAGGDGR